jgi:hypothetical protein
MFTPSLAAGDRGEDETEQFLKGELACSGEMLRGMLDWRIDTFRDESQKTVNNGA